MSIKGMIALRLRDFYAWRNAIVLVLALAFYALLAAGLKSWFYPGWTWKGYLDNLKSIAGFSAFLTPLVIYLWKAYKQKLPEDSIVEALRRGVSPRFATIASVLLLIAILVLGVSLAVFGEAELSPELLELVSEGNWKYAHETLTHLQTEPLRPEVSDSLMTYVAVDEAAETEQYRDSGPYHSYLNASQRFLERSEDPDALNSLSFAEASKAIFLLEGHPQDVLDIATQELSGTLGKTHDRRKRIALLIKLGDLKLASADYQGAEESFQQALALPLTPSFRAFLTARTGDIQFARGNITDAVQTYQKAEAYYPDPIKYLFYSNFGYLLLQANDYAGAEVKMKRALEVRADDWISYLNLGLVYDAMGRYADASQQYQMVINDGGNNNLAHREALILMGYSQELSGRPFETFISYYLQAEGRVPTPEIIGELRSNHSELHLLYKTMADDLRNGETHGIESYITWFLNHPSSPGSGPPGPTPAPKSTVGSSPAETHPL